MLEMTQPVVGATIAWLVLGQRLSALQVAGIVVTVVAIGVVERARMRLGHAGDLEVVEP
jgi:drug/metabolite transporter (DMT)-like permease